MKIERILVPTDFSEDAEKALAYATELAREFGAEIELMHAYDLKGWVSLYEVTFAERIEVEIRKAATRKLRPLVRRIESADLRASTHLVLGAPSTVILERVTQSNADLVVMGTRGLGAVKQVLLGSVAERTVRDATCPVLTVGAKVSRLL